MRYEMRVHAYDVMDQVQWTVTVWGPGLDGSVAAERVLYRGETLRGTGESDPSRWAADVLVAVLETL